MGQSQQDDADVGVEMCRNCGAIYHVTVHRRPIRTRDWYNCAVCGRLLMEWDSSESPRFDLVRPGPGYPPRKPR